MVSHLGDNVVSISGKIGWKDWQAAFLPSAPVRDITILRSVARGDQYVSWLGRACLAVANVTDTGGVLDSRQRLGAADFHCLPFFSRPIVGCCFLQSTLVLSVCNNVK